jgi:hypothetical protein
VTTIEVITTKMNNLKLNEMVIELHSAFRVFHAKNSKVYNKEDLNYLQLAFISELDLLEASKSKKQIIRIAAELLKVKKQGDNIKINIKEIYKQDTSKEHIGKLKMQIDQGEELTKEVMKNDLAELGKQIHEQVSALVTNLKQQQNSVQENTQQLKKDREDYKDNFWKRTLIGIMGIGAKVASVVNPELGRSFSLMTDATEKLLIHQNPPATGKINIPPGVQNAKHLKAEIVQIEFQGEQAKKKIYTKGIEETLSIDKRLNHTILSINSRKRLQINLGLLQKARFQPTDEFEDEVQNLLGDARETIERNTAPSTNVKSETSSMNLAQCSIYDFYKSTISRNSGSTYREPRSD